MKGLFRAHSRLLVAVVVVLLGQQTANAQFGIAFSSAGPDNAGMGGASTAAPIDPSGALYWNPAGITGLHGSQVNFGLEILYPHTTLSSGIPAGALGPFGPPVSMAGTDRSESGIYALPTVGLVYQPEDSNIVWGLGIFSAGGFAVNYPGSVTNPILTAQPPQGLGLGPIAAELQVFQIVPTVAMRVTDHLSIGIGPTLDLATLRVDPALLSPPDDADHDGFARFASGTHGETEAGGGFQIGVFYTTDSDWNFGASYKSPQWFQTFSYNALDEAGRPRTVQFRFDYPQIASIGTSYTGIERLVLAADFRYIDYHNTTGFAHTGFDSTGAIKGLGWNDQFALALGAQYEVSDSLALRMGYTYNTDQIPSSHSIFNVGSPLILEHTLYAGFSYQVTECFRISFAYEHAFENSITGPIITPAGAVPGSFVQSTTSADAFVFGATFRF
jgi:long-chain fatty acid transport protein